jgi:nicotinate-nucleotide adenylyltransferase
MCRLAAAGEPRVETCPMEVERGGPSYTVDTLRAIHTGHPDLTLTFILGADAARTIPTWREPDSLLRIADLAVAARGEEGRAAVLDALAGLDAEHGEAGSRVRFLEMAPIAISSSGVRERAASGEPIDELVGEEVAGYIREHRLYASRSAARR